MTVYQKAARIIGSFAYDGFVKDPIKLVKYAGKDAIEDLYDVLPALEQEYFDDCKRNGYIPYAYKAGYYGKAIETDIDAVNG